MKPTIRFVILFATLALLSACGGGGGSVDSGGIGGTGIVSTGVMTKGSVILNGVKFEDSTAAISIDDTPKTAADLRDGMVVQLLGRVGANGVPVVGTAQRVEAQIEVRGSVTSVHPTENPQRFVVLSQDVIVDDLTVYSDLTGFGDIAPNDLVEVHGLRDTADNIHATRVEADAGQMGNSLVDEIRGVVSGGAAGPNPLTFNLGTQEVNAAGAVIAPVGATYANDSVVEVHCDNATPCVVAGVFQASRLEVESEEDSVFQPGINGRLEVEGLITGFGMHPGSFFVAGIPVTTTGVTIFEGGISDDLGDDIKIEAEGFWDGSALIASKIEFKRAVVRLQGDFSSVSGNIFQLQIANLPATVTIETDTFTDGTLPAGPCVQIRGEHKAGGGRIVRVGEIKECSGSSGTQHFIRAPVEAESPEVTITLLGFALDVRDPTDFPDQWLNTNEQSISRTTFFNIVTPPTTNSAGVPVPGTLVKVKFDEVTNTVKQVEIED